MMDLKRRVILYEGANPEKARAVKDFLDKRNVDYILGFGKDCRFINIPYPVVSEGMADYHGIETVSTCFEQ